MSGDRVCRECGIDDIPPGTEIDGEPLCWADGDLCSGCQDRLLAEVERDATRYRYLRNRRTRDVDVACGGIFAGLVPENRILGGEDLDRAIDTALGDEPAAIETLERRLGTCLAEAIDTPLLTLRDEVGGFSSPLDLRLGAFKPELAGRAAELLEEAGL